MWWAYLVLVAVAVVLIGTVAFYIWAAQYFARKNYRYFTRRHLYVRVEAQVHGMFLHRRCATVQVSYEYNGQRIDCRFVTSRDNGKRAQANGRIPVMIDPDYPRDVTWGSD